MAWRGNVAPILTGVPLPGFSWIVQNYRPAVVNNSVTEELKADAVQQIPQLSPDDPF